MLQAPEQSGALFLTATVGGPRYFLRYYTLRKWSFAQAMI